MFYLGLFYENIFGENIYPFQSDEQFALIWNQAIKKLRSFKDACFFLRNKSEFLTQEVFEQAISNQEIARQINLGIYKVTSNVNISGASLNEAYRGLREVCSSIGTATYSPLFLQQITNVQKLKN